MESGEESDMSDQTKGRPTAAILQAYRQQPAIINTIDSQESEENLSSLFESDEPTPSTSKGILNRRHSRWNDEELNNIKSWKKYHSDSLARWEELLTKGSTNLKIPNKPKRTMDSIENNKSSKKSNKKSKIDYKTMNPNEFDSHLKQFIPCNNEPVALPEEMSEETLGSVTLMGIFIKGKYDNLNKLTLKSSIKLGEYLVIFQARFDIININTGCKETWKEALVRETGMLPESARQYMSLFRLVQQYSGLRNLQIPFTKFRDMQPTITKVFKENPRIASEWA